MDDVTDHSPHLPRPSAEIAHAARDLRRRETDAEALLWQQFRGRRLMGRKFRRQHPVGPFVLDFFCDDARLVVEVDGGVHREPDQRERDAQRQEALEGLGLTVLRFRNEEVVFEVEQVLEQIRSHLEQHSFEA
jgi:very-short-patch-repair endonuclease